MTTCPPQKQTTCPVFLGLLPDVRWKATDRPAHPLPRPSTAGRRRAHTRPAGRPTAAHVASSGACTASGSTAATGSDPTAPRRPGCPRTGSLTAGDAEHTEAADTQDTGPQSAPRADTRRSPVVAKGRPSAAQGASVCGRATQLSSACRRAAPGPRCATAATGRSPRPFLCVPLVASSTAHQRAGRPRLCRAARRMSHL